MKKWYNKIAEFLKYWFDPNYSYNNDTDQVGQKSSKVRPQPVSEETIDDLRNQGARHKFVKALEKDRKDPKWKSDEQDNVIEQYEKKMEVTRLIKDLDFVLADIAEVKGILNDLDENHSERKRFEARLKYLHNDYEEIIKMLKPSVYNE